NDGCPVCVSCEQPPPRRVKEIPTETWDNPPYPHDTLVTYKCRPGYMKIGRIVVKCADGEWKIQPLAPCKPCGHPGDTEFGSFQLTAGKEFVFGARVEYRCNDGYRMLSQKNYRECLAEGWSNDIPHCEVAKCLPVKAPENGRIVVSGAFELNREYSFGQVIEFECNEHYRLVGSKAIHCSSNGRWDSDVPQCQDIICSVPSIPNGNVRSSQKTYKESEQLHYVCNKGYTYGERANVQCTESGWYPTPYCTEVVCFPPTFRNGNFRPQKDRYIEGATITIDCDSGYRFSTLTAKNVAKCTSNGWVPAPGCIEKPCDYPAVDNIMLSRNWQQNYFPMRIGQTIYYGCRQGYLTPTEQYWIQIVCSPGGWKPEPQCLKICDVRYLENGVMQSNWRRYYKEGERAKYFCNTNYRTDSEDGEITCTKNGWSPTPRCIRKETCQYVDLTNGYFLKNKATFDIGETVTYRCYNDFVTPERQEIGEIQCQVAGWSPPPKCIQFCKTPQTRVLTDCTTRKIYLPGDTLEYACHEQYHTADNMPTGTTMCGVNGEWKPAPQCVAIECELPELSNRVVHPAKSRYYNGDVVKFSCIDNHVRVGPASAQCYYFGWFPSPPTCKVNPRGCGPPPEVTNGNVTGSFLEWYPNGNRMEYECDTQFKLVGSKEIECLDGEWSSPPSCIGESTCPPPPQLPNANKIPVGRNYKNGSKIAFSCLEGFHLIGANEITCINGKWQSPPYCTAYIFGILIVFSYCLSLCFKEKPCSPPQLIENADDFRLVNQNLKMEKEGKTVYLAGAVVKFICHSGFELEGPSEINCSMGNWSSSPTCSGLHIFSEMSCGSIPNVHNSATEGRNKEVYEPGETIRYQCDEGFEAVGLPEIICRKGNWSTPPFCEDVTCEAPPEIHSANIISTQQQRYLPGARVQYECDSFRMTGASTVGCQNGTWTELPTCRGKSGKCGPPPEIEYGDILSFPKAEYSQGETLKYKCPNLYILEGSQQIRCINGQWTNPPVCLVACTAAEEDMNNNNIELKWREEKKLYSKPGDFIEFDCKIGNVKDPASSPFRVQCINGTLKYPRCNPGSKSSPFAIVWLLFFAYLVQKLKGKPLASVPGEVITENQGVGNPVKL
uniref:Complement factor H n=1 Tax=Meleagris gallopavo TaxID=9103 RepID=A0A803YQT3_MELGA